MKKQRKRKIPAYAFGAKVSPENLNNAIQGIGGMAGVVGQISKGAPTTGGEAASQTISSMLTGAGSGAQIGSMFGPIGSGIGAVVGALPGMIGSKGGITETAGFTEDNQYALGTGLVGAFNNKKLKLKIARDKLNVQANRIAVGNTTELRSEFDEENNYDTNAFANGGMLSNSLAFVDDGELIQTPDGYVSEVPENGKPTDSNLMDLPEGSKILSDLLKVPGTKKTFAQIGKAKMSKKISKGRDKFAENTNKLNEMNDKMIHDSLFEVQEAVKFNKGIRNNKTKSFAKGGINWSPLTDDLVLGGFYDYLGIGTMPSLNADMSNVNKAALNNLRMTAFNAPENFVAASKKASDGSRKFNVNIPNILGGIGSIAPVVSNLFTGDADTVEPQYNPYEDTVARVMRKRKFDITPALRDINRNRAITNYNASLYNTNTGADMAYRLQAAANTNKSIADLYSQASSILNQYDADYANTLNALGQQRVGATNMAQDINAKRRAAVRNIRSAGLGQLSEFLLNRDLMGNQQMRDEQMLPLYGRFLEAGFTESDLNSLLKYKKNNKR